jgi:hypothetical protein
LVAAYNTAKASQPVVFALYLDFEEKEVIANEKLNALNRQKARFGTIVVVEAEQCRGFASKSSNLTRSFGRTCLNKRIDYTILGLIVKKKIDILNS